MLEKRIMGYVDFAYPQYEAKAVSVIIDSETGDVEIYRPNEDDTEWYTPTDSDHFYPTKEEAAAALEKHKQELFDKMGEVKQYLEVMNEWIDSVKEGDPLHFEESDYLPYCNRTTNSRETFWRDRKNEIEKEKEYLIDIIRTGFINIRGDSFKVDDIKHIKWGVEKAELILSDDRKVETSSSMEFQVIKNLFGDNPSNYTYTRLNDMDKDAK